MGRSINSTTKAELAKDGFRLATLFQIELNVTVKITDYGSSIVDGTLGTFSPSGHILESFNIKETSSVKSNQVSLVLSGVEQSYISAMMNYNNINKTFKAWRATLNSSGAIIGAPFMIYSGIITGYAISDSNDSSEISLDIASHWTDFERTAGRKTNSGSQHVYFPDDKGLEFSSTTKRDVKWGRK